MLNNWHYSLSVNQTWALRSSDLKESKIERKQEGEEKLETKEGGESGGV